MSPLMHTLAIQLRSQVTLSRLHDWRRAQRSMGVVTQGQFLIAVVLHTLVIERARVVLGLYPAANDEGCAPAPLIA